MSESKRNIYKIKKSKDKISFIILAAEAAPRMKSFGVRSLMRLDNNESVLENQLKTINSVFNNTEIILVTGYETDRLMNRSPDYLIKIENERYESTNTVRSVSIGLRACTTDHVMIIPGNIIFNQEAIGIKLNKSSLFINDNNPMNSHVGCNIDNNNIEMLMYDLKNKWSQIGYFSGRELKLLKAAAWNRENENKFFFEIINEVIDSGGNISPVINKLGKAFDIESNKDLEKIRGSI